MKIRTVLAALGVVAVLAGCGTGAKSGNVVDVDKLTDPIHGYITVEKSVISKDVSACEHISDGYADIHTGAQVTVSDAAGKILDVTNLEDPTFVDREYNGYFFHVCMFKFGFNGQSTGTDVYRFEVSHRGEIVKTRAELAEHNWIVQGTIG